MSALPQIPAWVYQVPRRPQNHPSQCYYRAGVFNHMGPADDLLALPDQRLTLFRFDGSRGVELTVRNRSTTLQFDLSVAELQLLRDAINDALQDIAVDEADRERRESFERIQQELRDSEETGGPGCYYCHPDVHYVPADQVQAKVAELEAAGVKRYMVLKEPV